MKKTCRVCTITGATITDRLLVSLRLDMATDLPCTMRREAMPSAVLIMAVRIGTPEEVLLITVRVEEEVRRITDRVEEEREEVLLEAMVMAARHLEVATTNTLRKGADTTEEADMTSQGVEAVMALQTITAAVVPAVAMVVVAVAVMVEVAVVDMAEVVVEVTVAVAVMVMAVAAGMISSIPVEAVVVDGDGVETVVGRREEIGVDMVIAAVEADMEEVGEAIMPMAVVMAVVADTAAAVGVAMEVAAVAAMEAAADTDGKAKAVTAFIAFTPSVYLEM